MFCSSVQNRDNLHDRVGSDSLFQVFINLQKFSTLLFNLWKCNKKCIKNKKKCNKKQSLFVLFVKSWQIC